MASSGHKGAVGMWAAVGRGRDETVERKRGPQRVTRDFTTALIVKPCTRTSEMMIRDVITWFASIPS